MPERIVNRNPYLYGPGPVRRTPGPGVMTMYSRMTKSAGPAQSFSVCAVHAIGIALGVAFGFKYFFGDPQIKAIEDYYKENPPR